MSCDNNADDCEKSCYGKDQVCKFNLLMGYCCQDKESSNNIFTVIFSVIAMFVVIVIILWYIYSKFKDDNNKNENKIIQDDNCLETVPLLENVCPDVLDIQLFTTGGGVNFIDYQDLLI
ncbi:Hypothetical_protein [Hexamita inflata]|uniref:Hypothetical_protein n=1 Tax=Hexamita inflata TaxID=28002 RepID=A0AA86PW00_9EUKA|nr:Hypothetical protein HINF_LOCUS32802 [Hexamita inflata]CAI9949188.1 Hypothetical protein HINF_LOCUS36833 [Hexamita inflata]